MNTKKIPLRSLSTDYKNNLISFDPNKPNAGYICLTRQNEIIKVLQDLIKLKKAGIINEEAFVTILKLALARYTENTILNKIEQAFKNTILENSLN